MGQLCPIWLLLTILVCVSAVSYTNDIYKNDDSEEDQNYEEEFADEVYYKKDGKKVKVVISDDTVFLPHEKYCKYFYVFDGKESYVLGCSRGYRFDSEKLQCLQKKKVDCGKRKKEADSSEEIGRIKFKCPKWSGYHPHEYYCHLFYYCRSKKPELHMCPPGLLFDSKTEKCARRGSVKCDKKVDPYEDNSQEEEEPDSSEGSYNCPESSGVHPHPKYCNKFIRCWFGIGDDYACPKDTLYDVDLKRCRSKESVYCDDRKDPYVYDDEDEAILEEEDSDFDCPKNKGRFSHDDCAKFYECKDGDAKLYSCPPYKRYDSKLKKCRDESEVVCEQETSDEKDEEFICPAREGIFKDDENCGYFYKCKNRKAYHLKCEEGELFDTDWKSCNNEDEVTCGERLLPGDEEEEEEEGGNVVDPNPKYDCKKRHGRFTHEEICNYYYHCKDGNPTIRNCRRGRYYDSNRNNCYEEVDCGKRKPKEEVTTTPKPREFVCPSKSGKYAHSKNCGAYYVCQKGKYKIENCPSGKLYHQKWRSCAEESKVSCGDRIHPDNDPNEPQDQVMDPEPTFKCDKNFGRYTHDEFCDWYYNCHDKKSSIRECRRGKFYDPYKRKCVHSKDVSCDRRKKPEDRVEKTSTTEAPTTPAPEFKCPKKEGKFPHEKDCSKFYDCKKGKHKVHTCPKNNLFDEKKWKCEPDKNAICGSRIHPDMDPDEPRDEIVDPDPSYNCDNHGRYAHEKYCHLYYNCHDKKASIRRCKRGKYFDSYYRKCYDSKDVKCDDRQEPEEETTRLSTITTTEKISTETKEISTTPTPEFQCPKNEGEFPHENDCSKFYHCQKGKHHIHTCPKNKLFDENKWKCEPDKNAVCGNRVHPDMDPDIPQDEIVEPDPDHSCSKNHGRSAHEKFCNLYYNCHDKKATLRKCKKGKLFDSYWLKCYDAKDVNCGDRQNPNDDVSTPSPTEPTTTESLSPETEDISTTSTPEFQCPKKEGEFPHENDCSKFYHCQKGKHHIHTCPKNKLFDENKWKCEPDKHAVCGNRIHPDMDPDEPQDEIVEPDPDHSCSKNHGRSAHEKFCNLYYNCHDNKATLRKCKKRKFFDSYWLKCYDAKDVKCGDRQEPDDNVSIPPTESTSVESIATETKDFSTSSEKSTVSDISSTSDTSLITSPEEDTTSKTNSPTTTEEITVETSSVSISPTSISQTEKTTVSTSAATETTTSTTENEVTTKAKTGVPTTKSFSTKDDTTVKNTKPEVSKITEFTTTKPITETAITTEKRSTIVEGKTTKVTETDDISSRTTIRVSTASESIPTVIPETTTHIDDNTDKIVNENPDYDCSEKDGLFAHETHCHYYYSCKNNKPTLRECPEGQAFDAEREQCEDWYLVHCGDRLRPDELDPTFDDFRSTEYVKGISTSNPIVSTTDETSSEVPFVCPAKDGIYPDDSNCGKYHICKEGAHEAKMCPDGQLFDLDKNACNEEQETTCGKRVHPDDNEDYKVVDPNPDFNCTERHGCFTHEVFCKWYYHCHDKRPEVRECLEDQYFDSVRNKCLDWWMVICDKRITPPESTMQPTDDTTEKTKQTTIDGGEEIGSTLKERISSTDKDGGEKISTNNENDFTESTKDDKKETKVTRDETERTTKDDKNTESTDTGRDKTGITKTEARETTTNDKKGITDSTIDEKSKSTTTSDVKETETTVDQRDETTPTQDGGDKTRITKEKETSTTPTLEINSSTKNGRDGSTPSDGKEITGRTKDDRDESTPTSDGKDGTGASKDSTISTIDEIDVTRSTKDDRDGSKSTSDSKEVTGVTKDGSEGTLQTKDEKEITGNTKDSGDESTPTSEGKEITGSKDESTPTNDGREKTEATKDGTISTIDEIDVTSSTKDDRDGSKSTTDSKEVTGVTSSSTKDSREELISTRDGREATKTTSGGRDHTISTEDGKDKTDSTSDKSDNTKVTKDGIDITGVTNEGTATTKDAKEKTEVTYNDKTSTYVTNDGKKESTVVDLSTSSTVPPLCDEDGNKTHEEDCSRYIECENEKPIQKKCFDGTLFDRKVKKCYPADWVECDHRRRPKYTTIKGISTTTELPIKKICEEEDGDFHHPKDCRLFFTCKDGEYREIECPKGMLFDNVMRICFDENQVNCGDRYRPPTTTETLDDCDEWLRTLTTPPDDSNENSGEVTQRPTDKETGSTETPSESSSTTKNEISGSSENPKITITTISDSTMSENISKESIFTDASPSEETKSTGTVDEITSSTSITDDNTNKKSTSNENPTTENTNDPNKITDITEDYSKETPTEKTDNTEGSSKDTGFTESTKDRSGSTDSSNYSSRNTGNIDYSNENTINTDSTDRELTEDTKSTKDFNKNTGSTDVSKGNTDSTEDSRRNTGSTESSSQITVTTDDSRMSTHSTDEGNKNSNPTEDQRKITGTSESSISTDNTENATIVTERTNDPSNTDSTDDSKKNTALTGGTSQSTDRTDRSSSITSSIDDFSKTSDSTEDPRKVIGTSESSISTDNTVNPSTITEKTNEPSNTGSTEDSKQNTGLTGSTSQSTDRTDHSSPITSSLDDFSKASDSTEDPKKVSSTLSESSKSTRNKENPSTVTDRTNDPNNTGSTEDSKQNTGLTGSTSQSTDRTDRSSSITSSIDDFSKTSDSTEDPKKITGTSESNKSTHNTENPSTVTEMTNESSNTDSTEDSKQSTDSTNQSTDRTDISHPVTSSIDDNGKSESTEDPRKNTGKTDEPSTSTINTEDSRKITENTNNPSEITSNTDKTNALTDSTTDGRITETMKDTSINDNSVETTHEHTTMHPCLNHTHSTPPPTPKIDCDKHDTDCIIKETGDLRKLYKCSKKQGSFPHPLTEYLFIQCRNWKPQVKKCGRKQIFSIEYMRCIKLS